MFAFIKTNFSNLSNKNILVAITTVRRHPHNENQPFQPMQSMRG